MNHNSYIGPPPPPNGSGGGNDGDGESKKTSIDTILSDLQAEIDNTDRTSNSTEEIAWKAEE